MRTEEEIREKFAEYLKPDARLDVFSSMLRSAIEWVLT